MMSASNSPLQPDTQDYPPAQPDPLSPGRTELNPDDKAGIDELPGNDGSNPADSPENPGNQGVPDTDIDNAEQDGQPNPR